MGGGGKEVRNRSKHFFPTPHKTDSCRRLQGEVDFGRCLLFFFFFNVGLEDSHQSCLCAMPDVPTLTPRCVETRHFSVGAYVLSGSVVSDSATPRTVARQAPLSMELEFSRRESWSGSPCPPPGDLPHPGIEPESLMCPALAGGFFTTSNTWEALINRWVDRCC